MSVFHICMWCLLVISVVHSQEMKTILLFTACLLNSNLWTSCECHTVNKAFLLNCSIYSLSHEKTPLQDQILIYVAFCFAKRKWRLGTICKRRIVESPKLTSVYWRTRSTQPWDWNWLFWQTVKKKETCVLWTIYCELIEFWARSSQNFFVAESLLPLTDSSRNCGTSRPNNFELPEKLAKAKQVQHKNNLYVNFLPESFSFWTLKYILIINADKFEVPLTNTKLNNTSNFFSVHSTRWAKLSMYQSFVAIPWTRVHWTVRT